MNDTPHTPVTDASGNVGPSTCDAPSCPQVNPPSGNAPRIHSMTVHNAESPNVESTGRSGRHSAGATAPKAATYAPEARTSMTKASSPNSRIQ